MKNTIFIALTALFISISSFAQQGINYKALIKDDLGNVVANVTNIDVQFTIYEGVALTNPVYLETHTNVSTDANGIVVLNIGNGTTTDVFTDIIWGNDEHWLNVQIDIGSGLTDISTTQFMAVPYALNVSGLEKITENDGISDNSGFRIIGRNPDNYGPIGNNAIDLSYRISASYNDNGATGPYSTAMGNTTKASGVNSTAMGAGTSALGNNSTAMGSDTSAIGNNSTAMGLGTNATGYSSMVMGLYTTAPSEAETSIGTFNTDYTPIGGTGSWSPTDRLFTIGNGSFSTKSDALIVLKNGTITAPSLDFEEITNNKSLITKEYLEATTRLPSGLEKITEFANSGWRLIGQDPDNYRNVGLNAIDFSFSDIPSSILGAWGEYSVAMGFQTLAASDFSTAIGYSTNASGNFSTAMGHSTIASGDYSTAMGINTSALGDGATAMGWNTESPSFMETTVGMMNTPYTPNSTTNFNAEDRVFTVGNGSALVGHPDYPMRNDALVILKNGKIGINTDEPQSMLEVVHKNSLPTSSNKTNALSITNSGSNKSFQLATHSNGSLTLYSEGNYLGYFNNSSGVYTVISDRRTKKDITPIKNGTLNRVMQLNPVSYLMKEQTSTKRNLGLISQEVQEIFPSLTTYVKEQDLITLSYTELIPILIKALQEQQEIINGQQITIETQKEKNTVQDKAISEQDKSIEDLVARLNLIESKSSN